MNSGGFDRYLAVETAGGPTWHPDGDRFAFAYNAPGVYHIYTSGAVKGSALWPHRLTLGPDRCTAPKYLCDGSLLFLSDCGGDENYQIGMVNSDGIIVWLTESLDTKHLLGKAGDSAFYYLANAEDKSRLDLYSRGIPALDSEPEIVLKPDRGIIEVDCILDGEDRLVLNRAVSNAENELLLFESGSVTSLTASLPTDHVNRWSTVRAVSNDCLLVKTDYESDLERLALLDLSGQFRTIDFLESKHKFEVEETAWTEKSPRTYYFTNEEGYSRLWRAMFSPSGVDSHREMALPIKGALVTGDARSFEKPSALCPDGRHLAMTLASPTNPANIWILEVATGNSWKATDSSFAGLSEESFVGPSLHRFKSFDGLSVPYFKYMPSGRKRKKGWPCIYVVHGGPEAQIRPDFNPVIQYFVSAGFAVITPNIRGSTGYGKRYMDLDNVEKRLDSIHDIRQLVLHIKKDDLSIDSTRSVIYGGSYGGFAVLSAMTEYPDLWRAGIDIVGISDFVTFLQNTAPWRRPLREAEYGSLEKDLDVLKRISPIGKVSRISAPLFIIQGDNDERVPLSESLQMYEHLKAKGLAVELLRFADEGHGLAKLENRIRAYSEVLEWLKENV